MSEVGVPLLGVIIDEWAEMYGVSPDTVYSADPILRIEREPREIVDTGNIYLIKIGERVWINLIGFTSRHIVQGDIIHDQLPEGHTILAFRMLCEPFAEDTRVGAAPARTGLDRLMEILDQPGMEPIVPPPAVSTLPKETTAKVVAPPQGSVEPVDVKYDEFVKDVEGMLYDTINSMGDVERRLKQEVRREEYNLAHKKRNVEDTMTKRRKLMTRLRGFKNKTSLEFDDFVYTGWLKRYKYIEFAMGHTIRFETDMIYIPYRVKSPIKKNSSYEDVMVPIGEFKGVLRFNLDSGQANIEFVNLTHSYRAYHHPHVNGSTTCLGDFDVWALVKDFKFGELFPMIIMYLETYNPASPYVNLLQGWGMNLPILDRIDQNRELFLFNKPGRDTSLCINEPVCPRTGMPMSSRPPIADIECIPTEVLQEFIRAEWSTIKMVVDHIKRTPGFIKIVEEIVSGSDSDRSKAVRIIEVYKLAAKHLRDKVST